MFKKISLLTFTLILGLGIAEFILYQMDRKPGVLYNTPWFIEVDSLEPLRGYTADSIGIFKMDTSLRYIFNPSNYSNADSYQQNLENDGVIGTYAGLVKDFDHLRNGKVNCNLYSTFQKIKQKAELNEVDSAILEYLNRPINEDGFFSIPFKEYNSKQLKILLIGDSFTWGHTTSNKALSFANELLAAGYVVYNTGISGTDPAQYEAVAEKYIPLLKPDIVVVNFFMGNDISYWQRLVTPYQPVFYPTNAGNLMAFQQGNCFRTPHEAYENALKNLTVPQDKWIRKLASKTNVGTLLWCVWYKLGMTTLPHYDVVSKKLKPSCNNEIGTIQGLCQQYDARFELMVIPDYKYDIVKVDEHPYLFEKIDYRYSNVPKLLYNMEDGHFNDKGHRLYAEQLIEIIHE